MQPSATATNAVSLPLSLSLVTTTVFGNVDDHDDEMALKLEKCRRGFVKLPRSLTLKFCGEYEGKNT